MFSLGYQKKRLSKVTLTPKTIRKKETLLSPLTPYDIHIMVSPSPNVCRHVYYVTPLTTPLYPHQHGPSPTRVLLNSTAGNVFKENHFKNTTQYFYALPLWAYLEGDIVFALHSDPNMAYSPIFGSEYRANIIFAF